MREMRGKLAIGITANFVNRRTVEEAQVPEISGVARIYNQSFFQSLLKATGQAPLPGTPLPLPDLGLGPASPAGSDLSSVQGILTAKNLCPQGFSRHSPLCHPA